MMSSNLDLKRDLIVISATPFGFLDSSASIPNNGMLDRWHSAFSLYTSRFEINDILIY